MKDNLARSIHINHCVPDSEIEAIEKELEQIDPGAWVVRDGQLTRYAGPFERPEQRLNFAAKAREYVPSLMKGLRVLEEALALANIRASSARSELMTERDAHRAAIERAAAGKAGPEEEIHLLARMFEVGENIGFARLMLTKWLGGGSVRDDLAWHLEHAERRKAEREKAKREAEEERARNATTLKEWVRKLEAGEVPEAMRAQWKAMGPAAKKEYLR